MTHHHLCQMCLGGCKEGSRPAKGKTCVKLKDTCERASCDDPEKLKACHCKENNVTVANATTMCAANSCLTDLDACELDFCISGGDKEVGKTYKAMKTQVCEVACEKCKATGGTCSSCTDSPSCDPTCTHPTGARTTNTAGCESIRDKTECCSSYDGRPAWASDCVPGDWPKFCSNGVINDKGNVCCDKQCGTCGGKDCSKRSGGKEACCSNWINGGKKEKMPMCKPNAKETRCNIPENAVLAQTRLEANGRHSSARTGRGLDSLSSMLMEDETNVKCQSQKWIDLEAGREEKVTSCNAPPPPLWQQVGSNHEKCKEKEGSAHSKVADRAACQAEAVAAGVEWYSLRKRKENAGYKCFYSKTCVVKDGTEESWQRFSSTTPPAPAPWQQVGDDREKCTETNDQNGSSEQKGVANREACQAEAVAAGVKWYSFRQNPTKKKGQDSHLCSYAKSCSVVSTPTTNEWQRFSTCKGPPASDSPPAPLWKQAGSDNEKCKDASIKIKVANPEECQAQAVCEGSEWYSFKNKFQDGGYKCWIGGGQKGSCSVAPGASKWKRFNAPTQQREE